MKVLFIMVLLSLSANAHAMDACDRQERELTEFCKKNSSKICNAYNSGHLILSCVF